ncbi:MAG: LacI family transcriptional regulator [Dorea sp.]|nr:LacI family transcriptional regulator [Dorea sp.]MCI9453385.1 LacI family transcriptional regulator [Dorea sp.]
MRTTIKDIANYTGFSVTTISLVLNGKADKIPKSTKDVIFDAVEKLNYRPNQIAVGLVKKRTKTIGLVISDVSNVFFSNLAKGVEDECRRNGWNLILCNTNDLHKRDLEYIQVLADKGVDGILFCMSLDSDKKRALESVDLMKKLKMPFVMIDRFLEEVDCCSVIVNHRSGGYAATKHLLELGHQNIACVAGPLALEDSQHRLKGYKEALEEYGIAYDPDLIYEGNYDRESGKEAVEYILGLSKKVTAIFSFNDMSAYGVYNRLKKHNYYIPRDMSLVGYDDIFFSEILDVPLTSVSQPVYDMGVEAVQQIISEIGSGVNSRKCITFQPKLTVRESTQRLKENIR